MGLFSKSDISKINEVASRSKHLSEHKVSTKSKNITSELTDMSNKVIEYFKDSPAILITDPVDLHEYVSELIQSGYAGIDTETTGLDRSYDTIVGASLYYPGGVECYIPMKHLVPLFDEPYKDQLTYEQVSREFQRIADSDVKLIFANADFDLAMIYKDLKVDFNKSCYYDVILAWRCLKEDEKDNTLKGLYSKYVLKGKGDPMKFRDFFSPQLFPYCKPDVAKLYAANDAKITYELFKWQLPYATKSDPKCKKAHLESISDLIWNVEFPLIQVCQNMHRLGVYIDNDITSKLRVKYKIKMESELAILRQMVDDELSRSTTIPLSGKKPFTRGADFNPTSPMHVKYLLYTVMNLPKGSKGDSTDKSVLGEMNLPITSKILDVRSLGVLINTFVEKLPKAVTSDNRIHAQFKQIGAATGRMCIAEGTPITVLDGCKNIEDIQPGDYVYCYSDDGELRLSKVLNQWCTGESRECVDIKWQSSGKGDIGHLICTPEHLIRKKSGEWVRADSLKRFDKLVHLRRSEGSRPEYRPMLYGWNGYAKYEQQVVKESIFHAGDGWVIHHIDGDPTNNSIDNLKPMTKFDHASYHAKKLQAEGVLSDKTLHTADAMRRSKINQRKKYIERVINSRDDLIQMIKDAQGRITKVPVDYGTFLSRCKIAGIDVSSECKKYNPRYYKTRIPEEEFISIYNKYDGLAIRIVEHFNISYDKFYSYCKEYGISRNHMVQSVKSCGKRRVFDIEVEGHHNFIASEINVHNSSADPNLQNVPSHADDIRHMFRATPGYVMLSSDYSSQEPRLTAFVSGDDKMIQSFKDNRDIYASIASVAFDKPYEKCLEFHPVTHEYQPDGKERRGGAKYIVLGICYGRSVPAIADQLYGHRDDMTDDEKVKEAQKVYDSVLNSFPKLRNLMNNAQKMAKKRGYVETILGRRRHLPNMQLEEFEFKAMPSYVNPDIDPLDESTLHDKSRIPDRVIKQLKYEFKQYKYFGQIARRTRELYDEGIRVINNRPKITEESRRCVNSIIQGSAADQTKLAMLKLESNEEWKKLGGRLLVPVHDELIAEVPMENYIRGGELLSQMMCDAASFLPFPSKCDVTTTFRWYGLEYPCPHKMPSSLENMEEDEIRWLQWHLHEMEYDLPIFNEADGSKPIGNAALGVSGLESDQMWSAVRDYKDRYRLSTDEDFIEHLHRKVYEGV